MSNKDYLIRSPTVSNAPLPSDKILTTEEEESIVVDEQKETLEEAVFFLIRHMMERSEDLGESEPNPINEVGTLVVMHHDTTSSSAAPRLDRH